MRLCILALLLLAVGCGIQIENKYTFADTVDTLAQDTAPETPETPLECNEAWICAYSNCDVMVETWDGNFSCIKGCYSALDTKHRDRVEKLHECAKAKCGDTMAGTERSSCIYQFCVAEWATCSNPTGAGSSSCGFIYRDALDNCFEGPNDKAESTCVGNVLKKGSLGGISALKKVVPCGPVLFDWAINPEACVDNLVNCFITEGNEGCGPILECQTKCFKDHCPAKLEADLGDKCETAKTSSCLVSCLYKMGFEASDSMKKLGRCMFNASHQAFMAGGANPYQDCLQTALACYGPGGQFYTCSQSVDCLEQHYDFFGGQEPDNFVPVLLCLQDSTQAVKLNGALQSLATAFEDAAPPATVWTDADDKCK